jgi:transcription elongation factor Elf1
MHETKNGDNPNPPKITCLPHARAVPQRTFVATCPSCEEPTFLGTDVLAQALGSKCTCSSCGLCFAVIFPHED